MRGRVRAQRLHASGVPWLAELGTSGQCGEDRLRVSAARGVGTLFDPPAGLPKIMSTRARQNGLGPGKRRVGLSDACCSGCTSWAQSVKTSW